MFKLKRLKGFPVWYGRKTRIYKNWRVIFDRNIFGTVRARASVVNKSDFIFMLTGQGQKNRDRYPGTQKTLTGLDNFDKKYLLRANLADMARELFAGQGFRALFNGLSGFEFFIKDDDGHFPFFTLVYPEDADVLIMVLEPIKGMGRDRVERRIMKIYEETLDILTELEVVDLNNVPIGKF